MRKATVAIFAFLSFQFANATTTYAPSTLPESMAIATIEPLQEAKIALQTPVSQLDVLFLKYAEKYQVSEILMRKITKCESRYNTLAHNLTAREDSWGLVQINLKAHTNISKEQATSPDFALDFLAKNIKNGSYTQKWITCSK